jgi:hypothetical protein
VALFLGAKGVPERLISSFSNITNIYENNDESKIKEKCKAIPQRKKNSSTFEEQSFDVENAPASAFPAACCRELQ